MDITYIYTDTPDDWNSSEWRCAIPARALNRTGRHMARMLFIQDFINASTAAHEACAPADVLVVQRDLRSPVQDQIAFWQARGKAVVCDFDDAYNLMEPSNNINGAYSYWVLGKMPQKMPDGTVKTVNISPPPLAQFKRGLRLVDAATVPSRCLADDWRSYTDIRYVPNYIELETYRHTRPVRHEGVILGWGGSASHLASFTGSGILAALEQVCQLRPDVNVMICGNDPRILQSLSIPAQQKIAQPFVSPDQWPQVLSNFDIGLAPLHGAYDDRRSWIKVLEYMVLGIPWLASRSLAYEEFERYGVLVKNGVTTWTRALFDAIDRVDEYRRSAAVEAYQFGVAQDIDKNIENVVATYEDILMRSRQRRKL